MTVMAGPGPGSGPAAVDRMAGRLTVPFARGADRLTLTLSPAPGGSPAEASVADYSFAEHRARFATNPDPRYIVTALHDVTVAATLTVGYEVPRAGAAPRQGSAQLHVPAGTLAGTSMVLHLGADGADEGPATRLRTLTMDPKPADHTPSTHSRWGLTALLGTMAKLLWVLGWERDGLRSYLTQVRTQRRLDQAVGQTLDLFGFDLGVPRFPPLPYSFEDHTVALWHLDDPPGAPVQDATHLFGAPGHPSTSVTARAGATGRFGSAFAFADQGAEITIADPGHADLALAATDDFTAECFVKPDDGGWEGAVLSKHPEPTDPAQPGWALSVGRFGRGITRNVRLLLSDGPNPVELFADSELPLTRFTHLAGVIDRTARQARLYLDGVLSATKPLDGVGALSNTAPVRIGRAGPDPAHVFRGVIDEVRLSRAARGSFHPVLGEDDSSYQRRLRIFRRWTLPTPASIQAALNEAVREIHGVANPLVVDDHDSTLVQGVTALTITPADGAAVGEPGGAPGGDGGDGGDTGGGGVGPGPSLPAIKVAVTRAAGDTATPEHGFDLLVGQTLTLTVQPDLPPGLPLTAFPPDALLRWSMIACGNGRVDFTGDAYAVEQPTVTVAATTRRLAR